MGVIKVSGGLDLGAGGIKGIGVEGFLFVLRAGVHRDGFFTACGVHAVKSCRPGSGDSKGWVKGPRGYGGGVRMRSSGRLEAESKRNVELMWLIEEMSPSHMSIAAFRSGHAKELKPTII